MLDFDLAEIYGYTTKAFNQQVKNNIERFPDDFRFQLTRNEVEELSRSKKLTSIQTKGVKGGRAYFPKVLTISVISHTLVEASHSSSEMGRPNPLFLDLDRPLGPRGCLGGAGTWGPHAPTPPVPHSEKNSTLSTWGGSDNGTNSVSVRLASLRPAWCLKENPGM